MNTKILNKLTLALLLIGFSSFVGCSKTKKEVKPSIGNVGGRSEAPNDSTFLVSSLPTAESERVRLDQGWRPSDFVPTGWYAKANSKIVINLEQTTGSSRPTLLIGTYNKEGSSGVVQSVELSPGNNNITATKSGLLFIRYVGNEGQNKSTVKIVSGVVPAPFYKAGVTTKEEWRRMLNVFTQSPDAVLYGGKIIIVVNRKAAIDAVANDQELLLSNANRIWTYENEISGLDNSSPTHKPNVHNHLMTDHALSSPYMAAFHHGTFYNASSAIQVLVNPNQLNGWGPWHEIGHHHQQRSYLWTGLTEVTVNIYSMYVERKMGVTPSRLQTGGHWANVAAYLNLNDSEKDYDANSDLFIKLAMFIQLSKAYGDEFYIKLHRMTREARPSNPNDLAKKRYFMLKACQISGHDLTNFFKDWGMTGVSTVYPEIAALKLPQPTVNPSQLRE